jgi:hypothetical protein
MVYFAFLFRLMGESSKSVEILLAPSSPTGAFTGDSKSLERPTGLIGCEASAAFTSAPPAF